jgi:Glycine zipper 2TM domain
LRSDKTQANQCISLSSSNDGLNLQLVDLPWRQEMVRKFVHTSTIAAITLTTLTMSAPVLAHGGYNGDRYEYSQRGNYDRYDNYRNVDYRDGSDRRYDDEDRRFDRNDRRFRSQKCKSGTTGTILGGVVGGLLGREIGRGRFNQNSGTTGLIIGAGAGALAGRAIEKSGSRC